MKTIITILIILLLAANSAYSQQSNAKKEINEQVWLPFIKSFSSGDDEVFRSVHSKEVTRVLQDDKKVIGYNEYFMIIPDSVRKKWSVWKKNIELRFVQRIAGEDRAFEVGYYKTTSTNTETGEVRKGIGKFHVLLRKENGVWKILMDADTNEGASEEKFLAAEPLD